MLNRSARPACAYQLEAEMQLPRRVGL